MSVLQGGAYPASYTAPSTLEGATATLTVTAPDGTVTTPAVTLSTPAIATATVPAVQVGTYLLVWTVTGAYLDAVQQQFTCEAASIDLIDLIELRDELNITPGDTTKTVKLRRWLKAATFVVENVCGPIVPRPMTRHFDGDGTFIVLPERWVTSITSMSETRGITNYSLTEQPLGQSVDAFGYTWDRTINKIVRRGYGGAMVLFPPGEQIIHVAYIAGMATIPDDIQIGTAELIKHWNRKDNPARKTGNGYPGQAIDESGLQQAGNYLVPNAVMELFAPWRKRPGMF